MMRRFPLLPLFFFVSMAFCLPLSAAPVWFDQVTAPGRWTPEQFSGLTLALFRGMKANQSLNDLGKAVPDDPSPRIVLISVGDEKWPCRTYVGSGETLREAVLSAVAFMRQAEPLRAEEIHKQVLSLRENISKTPSPKKTQRTELANWEERDRTAASWSWLKVEAVQAVRLSQGHQLEALKVAMGSMAGVAFSQESGFVFPPSQLVGRCLLTSERFLDLPQVGNVMAETLNFLTLRNWMELCAKTSPQDVFSFETDSCFTDGTTAIPLYRGHPYPAVPTAKGCLEGAEQCARAVLNHVARKSGRVKRPFPDWFVEGDEEKEDLGSQCELALACCRLAVETGDPWFFEQAQLVFKQVAQAGEYYGDKRQYLCVVEDESVGETDLFVSRKVARIRVNALAVLALDEMISGAPDNEPSAPAWRRNMKLLLAHLIRQSQAKSGFLMTCAIPSEQPVADNLTDESAQLEAEALGTLAIYRGAQRFGDMTLSEVADQKMDHLVKRLSEAPIVQYPLSPWLAEALSCHYRRHGEAQAEIARMIAVADASRETNPVLVDQMGMVRAWPSMTGAAEYSWILAVWANRFASEGDAAQARQMIKSLLPYLVFQRQAQIDLPTATALAEPSRYIGFCRDHLDDFGFDLNGQVTQILSLLRFSRMIKEHFQGDIPQDIVKDFETELAKQKQMLDRHPSVLTTELLMTDSIALGRRRQMEGRFSDPTTRKIQGTNPDENKNKKKTSSQRKRK